MTIHPFIVGQGRSSQAVSQALAILRLQLNDVTIAPPLILERGAALRPAPDGLSLALLANPHGLHAERVLEADRAGFQGILSEKPACVTIAQAESLRGVKAKTGVFHVYRQTWGPQTLKKRIERGDFGDLVSIEGRYWSSSTADRAIHASTKKPTSDSWKNKIDLSGPSDTLLDVGTHWVDMAVYLAGSFPNQISGWSSYANSESAHRDTHVHLSMDFDSQLHSLSSFSKNAHGSTNDFEITVFGTKARATWNFLAPDEILWGEGRERRVIVRDSNLLGTQHPAFHGAGWIEGYIEITRQMIHEMTGLAPVERYPTLAENLRLVEALLKSKILRNL